MNKTKNIAIITFDSKKTDLIEWSYFNQNILMPHDITAIGTAASVLEGTLNKKVTYIEPGNFGGYRQLCNLIAEDKIDALIIFGEAHEIFHTKYLNIVIETAVEHNIIISLNRSTADFLVHSTLVRSDYLISKNEKKQTAKVEIVDTTATIPFAKAS